MIQWCKSENGVDEMAPSRYELSDEQWEQIEGFFPPYTSCGLRVVAHLGVICQNAMAFGKRHMRAFVNGAMTGHSFRHVLVSSKHGQQTILNMEI